MNIIIIIFFCLGFRFFSMKYIHMFHREACDDPLSELALMPLAVIHAFKTKLLYQPLFLSDFEVSSLATTLDVLPGLGAKLVFILIGLVALILFGCFLLVKLLKVLYSPSDASFIRLKDFSILLVIASLFWKPFSQFGST